MTVSACVTYLLTTWQEMESSVNQLDAVLQGIDGGGGGGAAEEAAAPADPLAELYSSIAAASSSLAAASADPVPGSSPWRVEP